MTLAVEAPARTDDAPAPALDGARVTHMAATLIRRGYTSEMVRDHEASRPEFAYMWSAIAGAMDALAAGSVPVQRAAPDRGGAPA